MPDLNLDDFDEQQLRVLFDAVAARLSQIQSQEQGVRETLLDPVAVRAQIESLQGQIAALDAVIATPNSQVRDNPAPHIMATARASRRIARNTIRILRTSAGVLDSADLGEED